MARAHGWDVFVLGLALAGPIGAPAPAAFALDASLEVSQYAHTAWTVRDGVFKGNIYAIAQTPDGYLWLGTEFGLLRFDGIRSLPWQSPAGQSLPDPNVNCLLVTRDGTLWIGTFAGLVTWKDGTLTRRAEVGDHFIASLFEDRMGTVWVGTLESNGRLCAIRADSARCTGQDGSFGRAVWALYEDDSGALWAGAQSGLWRMRPGSPRQYAPPMEVIGLNSGDDGRLLIAMHEAGLRQLVGEKVELRPIRSARDPRRLLPDREVDANRLLRDRDGGLWIGTVQRGLIHLQGSRTDTFTRADGLSGDVVLSLFEDREGNIWVATTGGLDRFRELPVTTITTKQGLPSDGSHAVLAASDGSVWIGAHSGLTRWRNGRATVFRGGNGLPGAPQSLYEDHRGRVWVSTEKGLAYYGDGRFVPVDVVPGGRVHSMTGDEAGHLWLAEDRGLLHLRDRRLVEQIPWATLRRRQQANVAISGLEPGSVWLGFWGSGGGGVSYYRDGQLGASYGVAEGLGPSHVSDLRFDEDGALWAATHEGGVSRLEDGHITTLTSRNGLPCDTIHWTIEDDDHSFWVYAACGLVRIARAELDAWIDDPMRRVETTLWNAADGVRLRSLAAGEFGPRVAKDGDGRLWFVTGEGIQVVDPRRVIFNPLPPPVHVEEVTADRTAHDLASVGGGRLRLPALARDLEIGYTALSLVAPERVRFRYKLEGRDSDWQEAGTRRRAFYSDLPPGDYRFRVTACNNSGVWNEAGAALEFSIAHAYYQTPWFKALVVAGVFAALLAGFSARDRHIVRDYHRRLDERVNERTRIARELHDTLLQNFHGLLLRFQTASYLLPERPAEAKETLDSAIAHAAKTITEGRDAVQGLRASTVEGNDLAVAIRTLGDELASDTGAQPAPTFSVAVEGQTSDLHPIVRDEIYKIVAEALRNAFRHAHARRVEVDIRYDDDQFRLRVRDDGKGIDAKVLANQGLEGHYGLPGMLERAALMRGELAVWSEAGGGTELELRVPASAAYATARRRSRWSRLSVSRMLAQRKGNVS